jgi:hypothetical protein
MTIPHERARALRWGWDLLQSLASADSELTSELRAKAAQLLAHHPSAKDLRDWGRDGSSGIGIEAENVTRSDWPEDLPREKPTRQQYVTAVSATFIFVRDLQWQSAIPLSEELRREIIYVLRHYPDDIAEQGAVDRHLRLIGDRAYDKGRPNMSDQNFLYENPPPRLAIDAGAPVARWEYF